MKRIQFAKILFAILIVLHFSLISFAQQNLSKYQDEKFWKLSDNNTITWDLTKESKLPHIDKIEMDGQRVAVIISYEVNEDRKLNINRDIIFPQLRIFIESSANQWRKYRAYLRDEFSDEFLPTITVNKRTFEPGPLDSVRINGMLQFYHAECQGLTVKRTLLPSMSERMFVEIWTLDNVTKEHIEIAIGKTEYIQEQSGQNGNFSRKVYTDADDKITIDPEKSYEFAIYFTAQLNDEKVITVSFADAVNERKSFLDRINNNLVLETPNPVINRLFAFSKIRAAESIYDTKMGLVHSPGGGRYYTGVWPMIRRNTAGRFSHTLVTDPAI